MGGVEVVTIDKQNRKFSKLFSFAIENHITALRNAMVDKEQLRISNAQLDPLADVPTESPNKKRKTIAKYDVVDGMPKLIEVPVTTSEGQTFIVKVVPTAMER